MATSERRVRSRWRRVGPTGRVRLAPFLLAPGLLLCTACRDGTEPTVNRETFIATYADLRAAALSSRDGRIAPEHREEILEAHGVSEEELLRFVEIHGRDVEYMAEVWGEVEERLAGRALESDTAP